MKSIKITFLAVAALALFAPTKSFGWGREGHETIAKVAELNLKPSTKKKVEKYLGGHSIVYYAKWMDQIRKLPRYNYTDKWHTGNVDSTLKRTPGKYGDVVYAVNAAIDTLKNYKNLPDSTVRYQIQQLVHFVGDMHCPSHIYYAGHNDRISIIITGADHKKHKLPLHSVWDFAMIQSNRIMSATEWGTELNQVLTKQQKKEMASGSPLEWFEGNAIRCEAQYEWVYPDAKTGPEFVLFAMPLIETQISFAGIRLASILNALF